MSDDEGTNAARNVRPEDDSDGDVEESPPGDVDEERSTDGVPAEASDAVDDGSQADDATVAEAVSPPASSDTDQEEPSATEESVAPETSEDVENLLNRLTRHDDDLAREVQAIVETARERNATVAHQREELEDLGERIDEQAETIGDLQAELEERERELEQRTAALEERERELEEREEQIEELKSHVKRSKADFQNYKKRAKRREEQIKSRATEDLVARLVGVRDNLKRALGEESEDVESLREGLEMTMREFDRVLEDENVTEVDPEPGTAVDPQRHEVMVQVDSDQPEGTIADVFTPGYEMGEKVIQSAQVTVSNGELVDESPEDDATGDSESADDARAAEADVERTDRDPAGGELADDIVDDEMFTTGESDLADEPGAEDGDEADDGDSDGADAPGEDASDDAEAAETDEDVATAADESEDSAETADERTDEAIELGGEVESSTDDGSDG